MRHVINLGRGIMAEILELTEEIFEQEVEQSTMPTVVDFGIKPTILSTG